MLDLRKLLLMIQEQKSMQANMSLEFDCEIETDDPKPLVKVINYVINYLTALTDQPLEISLNPYRTGYMMGFAVFTEKTDLPPLSEQLGEALQAYDATIERTGEPGKYVRIIIVFA
jgi:hypothetical protein